MLEDYYYIHKKHYNAIVLYRPIGQGFSPRIAEQTGLEIVDEEEGKTNNKEFDVWEHLS